MAQNSIDINNPVPDLPRHPLGGLPQHQRAGLLHPQEVPQEPGNVPGAFRRLQAFPLPGGGGRLSRAFP